MALGRFRIRFAFSRTSFVIGVEKDERDVIVLLGPFAARWHFEVTQKGFVK